MAKWFITGSGILEFLLANNFLKKNQSLTIAAGIVTATREGKLTLTSESGTTDQLTGIVGLSEGDEVTLVAAAGHAITITTGTYLKVQTTFTLSGNKTIHFICVGGNVLWETSRAANT